MRVFFLSCVISILSFPQAWSCAVLNKLVVGGGVETVQILGGDVCGVFPIELTRHRNMKRFELSENQFYGRLPVEISRWKKLEVFSIDHNLFKGELPGAALGSNPVLAKIDARYNQFTTFDARFFIAPPKTERRIQVALQENPLVAFWGPRETSGVHIDFVDYRDVTSPITFDGSIFKKESDFSILTDVLTNTHIHGKDNGPLYIQFQRPFRSFLKRFGVTHGTVIEVYESPLDGSKSIAVEKAERAGELLFALKQCVDPKA